MTRCQIISCIYAILVGVVIGLSAITNMFLLAFLTDGALFGALLNL